MVTNDSGTKLDGENMPVPDLVRNIESLYDAIDTGETARRLTRAAYLEAMKSDDRSTKNGTLLVDGSEIVARGFNHFIAGYGDKEEHHDRPLKYSITEHAERDVIYNAAADGVATRGLLMVGHWVACPDCARAIAQSEINAVLCHRQCMARTPERWADMVLLGLEILKKNHVELIAFDSGSEILGVNNLNSGEIWCP